MKSTRAVDRHPATDGVGGKDDHPADRVAHEEERFALYFRDLIDDGRQPRLPRERRDDRVARQDELAKLGAVVQIRVRSRDVKLEWRTARQRLAPQELVIPPECWAESVRISSGRRVGSEIEGDVDRLIPTHFSTVQPTLDPNPDADAPPSGERKATAFRVPIDPPLSVVVGETAALSPEQSRLLDSGRTEAIAELVSDRRATGRARRHLG